MLDKQDGVLCKREWGVSKRDGVLVTGMGCYFPGCGVSKPDGVLVNGKGC